MQICSAVTNLGFHTTYTRLKIFTLKNNMEKALGLFTYLVEWRLFWVSVKSFLLTVCDVVQSIRFC